MKCFEAGGSEYPAGRRTRVILGEKGAINDDHFCQDYVGVYPGGSVLEHEHITVESYATLKGTGEMTVAGKAQLSGRRNKGAFG